MIISIGAKKPPKKQNKTKPLEKIQHKFIKTKQPRKERNSST